MSALRPHATDLSDDEWRILEPLVLNAKPGGRPRAHETRELLNTIIYEVTGEDALGGCCPATSCLGRPPTTTSGRGDHRLPDGQDYRERPYPRIRRWQEDQRKEAKFAGR